MLTIEQVRRPNHDAAQRSIASSTPHSADELQRLGLPHTQQRVAKAPRFERYGLAVIVAAFYLPIAIILSASRVLPGDAVSRTLSAASAAVGRDPHLEAIGFVWPPFPALFQVPLIWFERFIPELVTNALAGPLVSAALMCAMVCGVRQWLAECGVGQTTRLLLALLLAVHPFMVLFAGNGMSEASMLCFLVVAANRLARWWEQRHPLDLVMVGVGLAMAYLSRYEVGLTMILVTAAVAFDSARRCEGDRSARIRRALVDGATVAFVPVSAALAWAGWSWVTVGEPFAQFTSVYGNSAIVESAKVQAGLDRALFFAKQVGLFGAATFVLVALVLWFGTRGTARVVATVIVMFSPLVFNLLAAFNGTTFNFARFSIAIVPAGVMLLGPLLSSNVEEPLSPAASLVASLRRNAVGAIAVVVIMVSSVMSLNVMWSGGLSTFEESGALGALPWPYANPSGPIEISNIDAHAQISATLDSLQLPEGSVLTDTFTSFFIVSTSTNRSQFLVTSDRDFETAVASPHRFDVQFILVPSSANANYDYIRSAWPGIFEGEIPWLRLYTEWGTEENPATHYRLYRVMGKETTR